MHYNNKIREDIPQHKNRNLHKHTSATGNSINNTKGVTMGIYDKQGTKQSL